jgi:hypothetical protein
MKINHTFETLFLEYSEPVVIIETERLSDWKATEGSILDGKLMPSDTVNDYSLACKMNTPVDLLSLNGRDTLIALTQHQCSGACWLSGETGGTFVFMFSYEKPDEAEIRKRLRLVKTKDWSKLEISLETTSPEMSLISSLMKIGDEDFTALSFQLSPGFYELKHGVSEDEELGEIKFEFVQFIPGKAPKKRVRAATKKMLTLSELLKTGTDSTFKSKRALLDSEDWSEEIMTDAALAIERLTKSSRSILFESMDKRKNLIPTEAFERLEKFVLESQDPDLINAFLFMPRILDPDRFLLRLGEMGLLEVCKYGIEKFRASYYSQNIFTKLFSSAKTGREIVVISQVLQSQIRTRNLKGDLTDDRYLLREALGGGEIIRLDVREQMFSTLSSLRSHFASEMVAHRIVFHKESILSYFDSIEEFMTLLNKTIEIPKIAENRSFIAWLGALNRESDPVFREQTKAQFPKLWEAAIKNQEIAESWMKK